ncbi:MAG: putative radical SAM protein YgiQ [bacterium]|jgi:uncharacterized radical SAM protein YgiQ
MTLEETNGKPLDIILITGDAYVDHPSWGVSAIGRWVESHGFTVGIIAQPDWEDPDSFRTLGRPNLFFGVTAGNMDTMVNKYTAAKRLRSKDAYTPGGTIGGRPDRATIAYVSRLRQAHKRVPIVIGGVEASLRRLAHYDFWQNKVRGSMLIDSKADLCVFGMGEHPVVAIAQKLRDGGTVKDCRDIPGVAYALGAKEMPPAGENVITVPSLAECQSDGDAMNEVTKVMYKESNPHCGRIVVQPHGSRHVVQNAPAVPLTTAEMDRLHELPFTYEPHPCYREPIAALQSMQGSVTVNRGCSGGCSFCALTIHQGKDVTSRSTESVLREVRALPERKGFNGIISDLGGPTANMFHMACNDEAANKVCRRVSCLHPIRCKYYGTDHKPYLELLRAARTTPGIRKVYVNSGIRYDLASLDDEFVEELAEHHVQGQLSVAPEHASDNALANMKKPKIEYFTAFMNRFRKANADLGKKQFLVPYFQCAHPGIGPEETVELALYMKLHELRPRQVQMFMPTPATLATATYHSGKDPFTGKPVHVAKDPKERARQRALLFYWKREEWPHVREALLAWNYGHLIGRGKDFLVPPGPSYGAWSSQSQHSRAVRFDTHMGIKVERATKWEEREENWEAVAEVS